MPSVEIVKRQFNELHASTRTLPFRRLLWKDQVMWVFVNPVACVAKGAFILTDVCSSHRSMEPVAIEEY